MRVAAIAAVAIALAASRVDAGPAVGAGDAGAGDAGAALAASSDDDARFRAAADRLGAGDVAAAAEGFERLADELPQSPWADDARMEAALAAERLGQLPRARAQLEKLLVEHPDSRLVRRAESRLAQLIAAAGPGGEWSAVAAAHEAIVRDAAGQRDPSPQLAQLEALVKANPTYPRAHAARLWLGDSWLRNGDVERALRWYREAVARAAGPEQRFRAGKALGDALVARGDLDDATAIFDGLRGRAGVEPEALADSLEVLATARRRARTAIWAWLALGLLPVLAIAALRRDTGSWRAAARALARPPVEVLYFLPIAAMLVIASRGGNRLVAGAVASMIGAGLALAWISGASLEAARRRGPLRGRRVAAHVVAAVVVVIAVGYLAVMRDRLIDMLIETWRNGHDR